MKYRIFKKDTRWELYKGEQHIGSFITWKHAVWYMETRRLWEKGILPVSEVIRALGLKEQ